MDYEKLIKEFKMTKEAFVNEVNAVRERISRELGPFKDRYAHELLVEIKLLEYLNKKYPETMKMWREKKRERELKIEYERESGRVCSRCNDSIDKEDSYFCKTCKSYFCYKCKGCMYSEDECYACFDARDSD
jgi:5'-3' exonuclease